MQQICPFCHAQVSDNYYFCPNCGKQLHEPPVSLIKQLGIYAFSIFFPPLGLWPGIKYLLSGSPKNKQVGIIAIILTFASIIISVWIFSNILSGINQSVSSQMNQYKSLGY